MTRRCLSCLKPIPAHYGARQSTCDARCALDLRNTRKQRELLLASFEAFCLAQKHRVGIAGRDALGRIAKAADAQEPSPLPQDHDVRMVGRC
jgi:hypothetical protein